MSRTHRKRVEKLKGEYPYCNQEWFVCERFLERNQLSWYSNIESPRVGTVLGNGSWDRWGLQKVYARGASFGGGLCLTQKVAPGNRKEIKIFESDAGSKRFKTKVLKKKLNRKQRAKLKRELEKELSNNNYDGSYLTSSKGSSINDFHWIYW